MTKNELLEKIRASREALRAVLESVPPERRDEPGVSGGWSVKDILVHLTYWEGQLVTMLFQLRSGAAPTTVQFGAKDVEQINAAWFEQGRSRAWDLAWRDFISLGTQLPRRVAEFSDAELTTAKFHPKLKGLALTAWIASDSYEHEDEHRSAIEQWLK
jgi:uncharacterized damage-inducible protein DinB